MVDGEQDHRFDELCLNDRAAHDHNRLIWEDRRTLPHRPDVALERKMLQIVKKRFAELTFRPKIVNII